MFDTYPVSNSPVEGQMNIPNNQQSNIPGQMNFNTLDEPIKETIVCKQSLLIFSPY